MERLHQCEYHILVHFCGRVSHCLANYTHAPLTFISNCDNYYYTKACAILVIVIPLYIEPSLTVENLCDVLVDVKDWSTSGLPWKLQTPKSKVEELERSHPDLAQRKPAIIREYIDNHPVPSWELVSDALYIEQEYDVLERVQNRYLKGT